MERTTAQLQTMKRAIMSAGIPDDDDDYEDPTPAGYGPNTSMPMPVAVVALNGAARLVPPGWRNLLTQTHHKVRGAIAQSVRRRHVAAGLKVIITDQELEFDFSMAPDPVLRGILRKATVRSRCTCSQCGRRGRVREIGDDYVGTLCARCAAVPMLREHIWSVSQQSEFLCLVGQPVEISQVPEHLWPSFLRWADLPPEVGAQANHACMSAGRHAQWSQHLQALSRWLPSDHEE